jgi:hypothetical protein
MSNDMWLKLRKAQLYRRAPLDKKGCEIAGLRLRGEKRSTVHLQVQFTASTSAGTTSTTREEISHGSGAAAPLETKIDNEIYFKEGNFNETLYFNNDDINVYATVD